MKAPRDGDVLTAEAKRIDSSRRISHFLIEVRNGEGDLMASCQATAYRRTSRCLFCKTPIPFTCFFPNGSLPISICIQRGRGERNFIPAFPKSA